MKSWLKRESGSAMLLALIFLLFCTLTGSAIMASAAANGARSQREAREKEEWLACRSTLLVVREALTADGQPQLTIRDVKVREKKTSRRTVTYILQNCGDFILSEYLISAAVSQYEAETGAPDERVWEGFPFTVQSVSDFHEELTLTAQSGDQVRALQGTCEISEDLGLTVALGSLNLRMEAVAGTGEPVKISANGVTTVTKTTVIRWECPAIEKGDGHG